MLSNIVDPVLNDAWSPVSKFNTHRINSIIGTPVAFVHNNWKEGDVYKPVDVNSVNGVTGLRNANNAKSYKV
ncbi:MAG: hypothetical protein WAM42_10140 [Candidatus Nitrosopolaris sp.]|jgi:hypothetical protein